MNKTVTWIQEGRVSTPPCIKAFMLCNLLPVFNYLLALLSSSLSLLLMVLIVTKEFDLPELQSCPVLATA